jgi:flavin reductase (DIM6/NTAB) family NADH-FMN oxidoreductase RutF
MNREAFISAMGRAVTGVTVVATDGPSGRVAQTVNAMCSVSADPPMLLVCLNRRSPACDALTANGVFSVNVLAEHQAHVSDTFAGRPASGVPYDFDCAAWADGDTGSPMLADAVAAFDCRLESAHDAGTHTVFIGRVVMSEDCDGVPLAYSGRSYGRPTPIAMEVAA